MKTVFVSLLVFLTGCSGTLTAQHTTRRVLFLGNSYTYVNNLPQLIADIALANGDTLLYDSNSPGGQTFYGHSVNATSIAKINSQPWHQVILQAQSQEPSFHPSQVNAQTLPYALKLDSMIKHNNACTQTVFYETWGRKYGDASNCAAYPPICTYTGMQNRLKSSYKLFADTTHGVMSPVGEAFRKSITLNPSLELYQSDESHPSLEGSYLAACVFYEVLFHKSVLTNTYTAGISAGNVSFIQQVAHDVVKDSLSVWNIGKYSPYAPFSSTMIGSLNYQFSGSSPAFNNYWYFGDGTTSTSSSPAHVYSSSQTYTVSHVVTSGCRKDSSSMVLNALTSGLKDLSENAETLILYPNPAHDVMYTNFKGQYKIYDVLGNLCLWGNDTTIDVSVLKQGLYIIETQFDKDSQMLRFVKAMQ